MNTQTDTQRIQLLEKLVDLATGAISGFAQALNCNPDGESVLQAINDMKTRNWDLVSERNAAIAAERTWETTMMRVCGEDGPASVADKFKALAAENVALKSVTEGWMHTPATDTVIASIRADGIDMLIQNACETYNLLKVKSPFLGLIGANEAERAKVFLEMFITRTNLFVEKLREEERERLAGQSRQEGAQS